MSNLEQVCEKYANAFKQGFDRVVGRADAVYPSWGQYSDAIKEETMRCMRHALEEIRDLIPDFDKHFPEKLEHRKHPREEQDALMAKQLGGKINE